MRDPYDPRIPMMLDQKIKQRKERDFSQSPNSQENNSQPSHFRVWLGRIVLFITFIIVILVIALALHLPPFH